MIIEYNLIATCAILLTVVYGLIKIEPDSTEYPGWARATMGTMLIAGPTIIVGSLLSLIWRVW